MKTQILNMATVLTFCMALVGCGLFDSEDKRNVKIQLDGSILSPNNQIVAEMTNQSSETVLVFQNTNDSQIQRKNSNGVWVVLQTKPVIEGEPMNYMDWYANLESGKTLGLTITSDLIANLAEINSNPVSGEYRVIYAVVFNQEYENTRQIVSKSFRVNVD